MQRPIARRPSLKLASELPTVDISRLEVFRRTQEGLSQRLRHMAQLPCSLVVLLLVVSCAKPSLQDTSRFEFVEQPEPFYYTLPTAVLVVPCRAEEILEDDSRQTVSTTMFVNSFTIGVTGSNAPPDRYFIHLDDDENMIGLLIVDVGVAPSPSVLRCSVVRNGSELCNTGNSTVIIGDGRPLQPPGAPYHMMDGFRLVQLQWEVARTPALAPITSYAVTYWLRNLTRSTATSTTSPGNSTLLELTELAPGGVYSVVVQGVNSFGRGEESAVGEIMPTVGEVPPMPSSVNASVRRVGQETTIRVSWTPVMVDLQTMTALTGYVVSLSNFSSALPPLPEDEQQVDDPSATEHTITVRQSGTYRVGVASRNLAGQSEFLYYQQELNVSVTRQTGSSSGLPFITIIIAAVAMAGLLVILVIFGAIICVRRKMGDMNTVLRPIHSDESSIESPSLRKKADSEDAKASLPATRDDATALPDLGGADLRKDEQEEAENWHRLIPTGRRPKPHSLIRSQSEMVSRF